MVLLESIIEDIENMNGIVGVDYKEHKNGSFTVFACRRFSSGEEKTFAFNSYPEDMLSTYYKFLTEMYEDYIPLIQESEEQKENSYIC
jgi:hypothetical protein